eukprot:CAMPEP_0194095864 /NCGR_PEP_ID=MMETSP0149-20130528/57049_1 /TAXON_ID=122233 /ORGANISM="Chaetoceros debilis, Strain MM31A-1" /LENGTH=356 /DNA_ID=CAMNT_0038781825 /DNA_START=366 /DNA_END=1439 /DNA_ORIENTATION=-
MMVTARGITPAVGADARSQTSASSDFVPERGRPHHRQNYRCHQLANRRPRSSRKGKPPMIILAGGSWRQHSLSHLFLFLCVQLIVFGGGAHASSTSNSNSADTCGTLELFQDDYRGDIAVTIGGKQCQRWDQQSPHAHSYPPETYPAAGLDGNNFCRNPSSGFRAWCYTTDPNVRWEYCDVPVCGSQINVARSKSTFQSSSYNGPYDELGDIPVGSNLAVDGNWVEFTHTQEQVNPWWKLYLSHQYSIDKIAVYNRDGFYSRLSGFRVEIFIFGVSVFQYNDPNVSALGLTIIDVPSGTVGNEVVVSIPGNTAKILSLGEVEVYGAIHKENVTALSKAATQSSVSRSLSYQVSQSR